MEDKTCAEINLSHLRENLRAIRQKVAPAQVIPVVKADAYGHGAIPVCRCLATEGVRLFAVAHLAEALELRESGLSHSVLIFGRLFPDEIAQASAAGFTLSLFGCEDLRWIEKAKLKQPARVHVNLDTGMGRSGLLLEREPEFFDALVRLKACVWEGMYTHFATADERDKSYARRQLKRFQAVLDGLAKKGLKPSLVHMANSGAVLDLPESYFDAVRPGILLYGHYPSPETSCSVKIKQVMTLKTYVAHIRRLSAGQNVSYGCRWQAPKETSIAVLPMGYADGIRRDLTNQGEVLIRGRRYPMVGTVTMDSVMIDVGDEPIQPGDEAVVWGDSPQGSIQASEVAAKIGTIPYELTCGVSRRVRRTYRDTCPRQENIHPSG